MSDDTPHLSAQRPVPATAPLTPLPVRISELRTALAAVGAGLRKQAELLRVRQIEAPLPILNGLAALDSQIHQLQETLADEDTEIGQLQGLAATYAMINSSLEADTVLAQALDEIVALTGAERGFILLTNPDTADLEFRIMRGIDAEASLEDVSRAVLREVLATGQPILTNNASRDPLLAGSDTVARFTLRSILAVPLIIRDRIDGAIYVDNRFKEGVFTERELTLLTAFANQTAVAVENALLFAQIQSAVREMARAKDLIENVFASIDSGVITTDTHDAISTLNAAAARMLALPPDRAVGMPIVQALPPVVDLAPALTTVRVQGQPVTLETETEIAGRGRVALTFKLSPLTRALHADDPGIAMVVDDRTDERQREQTLDLMRRYLPPGMVENIQQIAQLARGGDRRELTCAFLNTCYLAHFPPGLRPAQMMELLNVYLETATEVIHAAKGVIDKYMGSEIMILFNTPLNPDPAHAHRAVTMALDLRAAFRAVSERLGLPPDQYAAGIHTGVATVGNVGSTNRRNFTALGDTINLTKRIQESAALGQLLLSGETLAHVTASHSAATLPLTECAPLIARGRTEPTRIFELSG